MKKENQFNKESGDVNGQHYWNEFLAKPAIAGCDEGFIDFSYEEKQENKLFIIHKKLPEDIREYPPERINEIKTQDGNFLEILDNTDVNNPLFNEIEEYFVPIKKIVFQDNGGMVFDMKDLLPPDAYLIRSDSFAHHLFIGGNLGYEQRKRFFVIAYNSEKLRKKGGRLSLLHEIGHSQNDTKLSIALLKKMNELRFYIKHNCLSDVLDKFSADERSMILQQERDAWAWAIKTLRALRTRGIDLIPGWEKEDIKKWIESEDRLGSYEDGLCVTVHSLREVRKKRLKK